MANNVRDIVLSLNDSERKELIDQVIQFERDGFIGNCMLRTLATTLPEGNSHVTLYMISIGNECYRYFANRYFESL